ncbi:MAG: thioredoxin [Dehalococcoidales bacterium]|jgi:thioredoxin 1|nr:thioredoxin [Dehalococcoidales bacterium]MDP6738028.1 thioredoxin [Dehalococcoidales bacterium]|tara:strand:- start:425 stop:751 length:327 start_codon:yes stop_codon:yes gene_type:complete
MSNLDSINDIDFDQKVLQANNPVLVDFWASWCRPCLMVAPMLDELAEKYDGRISFVKVDVDQNPKTAARYNVMSIPTILIFKDGQPVSHMVGLRPKEELRRSLDAVLG